MSHPSRQTEQTDERENDQLVDTELSVVEPTAVVEGTQSEAVEAQGENQDVSAIGESAQAAGAAARTDTSDLVEEGHSSGPTKAESTPDTDESRKEIEDEAIRQMAQRAANMNLEAETTADSDTATTNNKGDELPASPPPPPVPQKDHAHSEGKKKEKAVNGLGLVDEKATSEDSDSQEVPEAPQGTSEQTGEEIQTIMHQFQEEEALGEQEIMSPRLEKQQPIFHLPPRTSSLENQEKFSEEPTPGIVRRDTETFFGSPVASKSSPITSPPQRKESADDSSSVTSRRTSLFQPPPPSPDPEPPAVFDFHKFLEQLRHRTADPVARYLRSFLQEFVKKPWAVHEQVKIIGDFLEFITKKMAQCEVWASLNDDEFDNAREGMEKLVMNRLYSQTFSPAIPAATTNSTTRKGRNGRLAADASSSGAGRHGQHEEDVERDAVIAQKMRIYGWIKTEHLDMQPVTGEKPQKFLKMAQQELLKINTYRAPRDKVICVLNTCKVLFGFLKNSKSDQSADAFVPLLIYTVLRAAPEHLVSNVQYIWRFRNQDKLGGEAGYYMSSLMGVVTFIEGLDRTSLTISDEEFESSVEQAVSAIAEGHKAEEQQRSQPTASVPGLHHLSEKSTPSRPEVTPRNSMDGERSSPRKSNSQRSSTPRQQQQQTPKQKPSDTIYGTGMQDEEFDAVGGLLRSIQKPLSSIGRIFSDDGADSNSNSNSRTTPPPMPPRSTTSPFPGSNNSNSEEQRQQARAQREALTRASVEAEESRKARTRELRLVVE